MRELCLFDLFVALLSSSNTILLLHIAVPATEALFLSAVTHADATIYTVTSYSVVDC